ncbi:MAG: hypothetical protein CUN52_10100 [Phototrophicales bacterium]|jgi:hypothetical protein|nr:MAG: hypothetical protein CUN52_10100 [Phototrophicales bacterium]
MDNYRTLDQLRDELKEQYPQLRINRDSGHPGEYLLIYDGDKKLAQLEITNQGGDMRLTFTLESPKPETFPTFAKAKKRLKDWLNKQFA